MKILLADDEGKVRSAIRLLLEQEADYQVVGELDCLDGLLSQVQEIQPDLLLLDWEISMHGSQVDLLNDLHNCYPKLRIIALSGRPESRLQAFASGVDGFVSKGDPPERLLEMVHRALV